jgi:hypothetical protein
VSSLHHHQKVSFGGMSQANDETNFLKWYHQKNRTTSRTKKKKRIIICCFENLAGTSAKVFRVIVIDTNRII